MFAHMPKTPRLIGSAQAAKILGVDRATVNRWAQAGYLEAAYEPDTETGARLYDPDVVDQLAAARKTEAASTAGAAS